MQTTAEPITLGNWLSPPVNRASFWRVPEVLPVATVDNDPSNAAPFEDAFVDPAQLTFDAGGETWTIERLLETTYADGFLILRHGKVAFEWYAPGRSAQDEHLVFSVTKSLIGCVAGALAERGQLQVNALVSAYVPELGGSGFAGATVRDVLDMNVALAFEEAYLDPDSAFARYRRATGWHELESGETTAGMHAFLGEIPANGERHGTRFNYLSPNSDVLGWICERAAGRSLASLISELIWKPMGAEGRGFITLDRYGAPRGAGGFGCTPRDLARLGECMRNGGVVGRRQVIPNAWVQDIRTQGDRRAWDQGGMTDWLPGGCYRSQWWITNDAAEAYFAAGIFGQWLYVSPKHGVVIVKLASPPVGPADKDRFRFDLNAFATLAERVG